MGKFFFCFFFSFLSILPLPLLKPVVALPLYTNSRWIVDEDGARVKLACVNWPSHLEAVVAEGLSKQPVAMISKKIGSMGFNCVRLTWPLFLATNQSLASLTVRQSFQRLGLLESIAGFQANNPSMVDLPLISAYQAVVSGLADNNVMVILDNHLSKPGWCCSSFDGNGFFGDQYFNPDLWVQGLTRMATMFRGVTNVVGMSLRNELRGPKQNVKDWYRYMQKGAEAVHSANPDVLVIVSGLSYDTDLSFVLKQELELTFTGKLVFEMHWYGFTDGSAWETGSPNQVCGRVVESVMRRGGVLLEKGWPLFVSEFGVDQRGTNVNDNRYLNCFFGLAAELDFDWALWTLVGSYYTREGVIGLEEFYGLLNWNWCEVRNSSFLQRISALQSPFQGPDLSDARPHKVIFHPATGLCIVWKSVFEPLTLGPCPESDAWSYTPQKTLIMKETYFCLQADGPGNPGKLGIICTEPGSKWESISDSKMHLSTKLGDGTTVCLDIDSSNNIVTNACKCLSGDNKCDPGSQWFKIVNATNISTRPLIQISSNLDLNGAEHAS
ncbi:hypothetical protein VitviT2T_000592 [Vitis vinifera]|uniref:Glycoside hydrolase family 5 domain-containing protein n=2 Tax=Vitis vinifera TaxID=29760 RepID=F6GVP0_VITVI|nr:glycosyl hydrolase 5 family protein [Vitis vinifera]WJZ80693.1 hypothetical protein VitviT2T_000592 [Vitis vinifera]|eukprot:XP_002285424.1 PREDICTED: uncharacterized protein LOC100244027 [Vitis vinifera]